MTALDVSGSFVLQSSRLFGAGGTDDAQSAMTPPEICIHGLRPGRHYLLTGARHRFCRADAGGLVRVAIDPASDVPVTIMSVV